MAKRKKWIFTDLSSQGWSPAKARAMLQQMEMSSPAIQSILDRFWFDKNVDQIDYYSKAQQNKLLPLWDKWVRVWLDENKTN